MSMWTMCGERSVSILRDMHTAAAAQSNANASLTYDVAARYEAGRSPWESDGEYRVRLALDAALSEWRAQGMLTPQTSLTMATKVIEACEQDKLAVWSAMSLLEQMHGRKVIGTELFRYLKEELNGPIVA